MNTPLIVQYWHSRTPPDEVAELMETWEMSAAEGFAYKLFDDDAALNFIRANYDERTAKAYLSCAVPAMKADFFRICALLMQPGIYVDADMRRTGVGRRRLFLKDKTTSLFRLYLRLERGLLFKRGARVANSFIIVKRSDDVLLQAILTAAIENIEQRTSNNVYAVTGPGIATKWFNALGSLHPYFRHFEFWTADELLPYMRMVGWLPYKRSDDHWVTAQRIGSIFTAPAGQVPRSEQQPSGKAADGK